MTIIESYIELVQKLSRSHFSIDKLVLSRYGNYCLGETHTDNGFFRVIGGKPATTELRTRSQPLRALFVRIHFCHVTSLIQRRGMLVNHLWRSHQRRPKGVPVKRKVLHYPCGICPKIYRAAAKRDHHVWKHHPSKYKRSKKL